MTSDRVAALLEQLTPDEKLGLDSGRDMWHAHGVPRLGVPALKVTDGPNGARGAWMTGAVPTACVPCGTALATSSACPRTRTSPRARRSPTSAACRRRASTT